MFAKISINIINIINWFLNHLIIFVIIYLIFMTETNYNTLGFLRIVNGEYVIANYQQQNLSCANWTSTSEANIGNCTRYARFNALKCYGAMNNLNTLSEQKIFKLEQLILCGYPLTSFNPINELQRFPKIRSLSIEYSDLTEISKDFPEMLYLEKINISWTNLSQISPTAFERVFKLKIIDLRWNQLVQLNEPFIMPAKMQNLYLAGNPWNCTRNFKWLLIPEYGNIVSDRNDIFCTDRKYKERLMMIVMNYKVILKEECQSHPELRNCTCTMHHILPKNHIPLYTVDCSNRELIYLPSYLPPNTTMLYVNNNSISDVRPLRNNPHYRQVEDLHLDNNLVTSIDELEGSNWLERFRLLSLRGNKLKKIPVYALSNALEDNHNANLILLSMNPWFCTCKFAMRFREMLIKYNDILRDSSNITCTYNDGDNEHETLILTITRDVICKSNDEPNILPLDLLNGFLASLLVFIVCKLAYDCYIYKNYGRVPWIVMKMP